MPWGDVSPFDIPDLPQSCDVSDSAVCLRCVRMFDFTKNAQIPNVNSGMPIHMFVTGARDVPARPVFGGAGSLRACPPSLCDNGQRKHGDKRYSTDKPLRIARDRLHTLRLYTTAASAPSRERRSGQSLQHLPLRAQTHRRGPRTGRHECSAETPRHSH